MGWVGPRFLPTPPLAAGYANLPAGNPAPPAAKGEGWADGRHWRGGEGGRAAAGIAGHWAGWQAGAAAVGGGAGWPAGWWAFRAEGLGVSG